MAPTALAERVRANATSAVELLVNVVTTLHVLTD